MSLGMFCGIPLPFHIWDEKLMRIMISCFPLVGFIIGGVWWAVGFGLFALNVPLMLTAAVLTFAPFFTAGFIHMDGYMDTSDARLSRRDFEERVRILKDPLVGAFAVIMLVILILVQFAAVYVIAETGRYFALVIAVCVVSRCCSVVSIFTLRHMKESHYGAMLGEKRGTIPVFFTIIVLIAVTVLSFIYAGFIGLIVVAAVVLGYSNAMRIVYRDFKGVSGDLLGYSLVIGEVCGLVTLAALGGVLL